MRRCALIILVFISLTPLAALAAETTGQYITSPVGIDPVETDLGGGYTLTQYHYTQVSLSDDPADGLQSVQGNCVSNVVATEDGTVSVSGSCTLADSDGNGSSTWWRAEGEGHGVWGYVNGWGSLAGIKGGGTWKSTEQIRGAGAGTYEGKYEIEKPEP